MNTYKTKTPKPRSAPKPLEMFNLVEYLNGQINPITKAPLPDLRVRTVLWNVPYGLCIVTLNRIRLAPKAYGTYWKIEANVPKKKEDEQSNSIAA